MRVLFLGAPCFEIGKDISTTEKFIKTGENTGNLLIGHALKRQIKSTFSSHDNNFSSEHVNENFDLIAVAAANFINKNFDFTFMADYIEKTNLPCFMVGLGAQAPNRDRLWLDEIPNGTIRLLKIVAERSKSIGVRGFYTAEILDKLGINSVDVVGCPSLYWNMEREIKIVKNNTQQPKICLNGSRNVTTHSEHEPSAKAVEASLIKHSFISHLPYFLQNEIPEMQVCQSGEYNIDTIKDVEKIIAILGSSLKVSEYIDFIVNNCRVYFCLKEWSNDIRNYDMSIGTRFHGNVIAIINGVPAVIIPHDSRTKEMAELFKIPTLPLDFLAIQDLKKVYNDLDYSGFEENFPKLFDAYKLFMKKNNVSTNF